MPVQEAPRTALNAGSVRPDWGSPTNLRRIEITRSRASDPRAKTV